MYAIVITANDIQAQLVPFVLHPKTAKNFWVSQPIQSFVIVNANEMLVTPQTIAVMLKRWKDTFHPSELPITERMQDAPLAFLTWLADQPFGYIIPHTSDRLTSLPIYDRVEAVI